MISEPKPSIRTTFAGLGEKETCGLWAFTVWVSVVLWRAHAIDETSGDGRQRFAGLEAWSVLLVVVPHVLTAFVSSSILRFKHRLCIKLPILVIIDVIGISL